MSHQNVFDEIYRVFVTASSLLCCGATKIVYFAKKTVMRCIFVFDAINCNYIFVYQAALDWTRQIDPYIFMSSCHLATCLLY